MNRREFSISAAVSSLLLGARAAKGMIGTLGGAVSHSAGGLPNATVNGAYFYKLSPQAAYQPSTFSMTVASGTNSYFMTRTGTLYVVPSTAETATLSIVEIGADGATYSKNITLTCDNVLRMGGYSWDRTGAQPIGSANVGTKYSFQLQSAAGGSGTGYIYAVSSGALPAGLSMTTGGLITGTPTTAGTSSFTVQVTDSASNTADAQFSITVNALSQVSRPAYNTGTGFFVDGSGVLRDPNGYEFRVRGLDRNHYDSACQPGMSLAAPNTCRMFMYLTDGSIPSSTYASTAQNDHIAHNEVPIVTMGVFPNGVASTGDSSTSDLALGCGWWYANVAAFSTQMPKMMVNVANEWGPSASTVWENSYLYVESAISNISGTTITLSSNAATNPFANCPFAVIKGAGGISDQVVDLSSPGGVSGAWTVTSSVSLSGYTSGGALYGGAVGVLRAAGYTCPLVIDSGGSGQDEADFDSYAAAIQASDPQQNCVFSYHLYGDTDDINVPISGITNATNAVITLNYPYSSPNAHPFSYGSSPYTGIAPNNNTYFGKVPFNVTGVSGMTQINGTVPASNNSLGGVQGSSPWVLNTTDNTTSYGTYTSGGQIQDFGYYANRIGRLAALRSSGVCVIVGEFGPGRNIGPSPTLVNPDEVITACEANNVGWIYWAWDDNDGAGGTTSNSWFGCQKTNGTYAVPSDLTEQGLDAILNPNYGVTNLAVPAEVFL